MAPRLAAKNFGAFRPRCLTPNGSPRGECLHRVTNYERASYYVRQPAAFLTSFPIFSSIAGVSLFTAKEVGQKSPSSRFASCWKPKVAYLDLNFAPLWKKQMTLPSFA